ncbi:MAG: DUF4126 domain-containing protein [Betaproteobacteria bacterium]
MSALVQHLPELALAAALAWGSGLRAYLVVFVVGLAGSAGWIELPAGLRVLQHPLALGASGFMTFVEFFADKLPWIDSLWDAVHSFIRIPAGAALAAAVFADSGAAVEVAAAILGGSLAASAHLAKAGSRALVNTSPEPFSNWALSLGEDALVPATLWLAFMHPVVLLVVLAVLVLATALLARAGWKWLSRSRARVST